MLAIESVLDRLWDDYATLNPSAREVYDLLVRAGGRVPNDHIAFRTFDWAEVRMEMLAYHFVRLGYVHGGDYDLPQKHATAIHLDPPRPGLPKVFISQLRTKAFSNTVQDIIMELVEGIPEGRVHQQDFLWSGTPWRPVSYRYYELLRAESEYAAWLAAFGYRANHFTVAVHDLPLTHDIFALNRFLKANGHALSTSGGEIKGSPAQYLEQSSTLAVPVPVAFSDGTRDIPGCYYEFAKRYPMPDGKLFGGFVEASATKLFDSTANPSP
jgi:hypothetical protein